MKDIVIIGAGGFGREVAWLIEEINKTEKKYNLLGFIDENKDKLGTIINGYKVIGDINYFRSNRNIKFVVAIGNANLKKILAEKAIELGAIPETIIHPNVAISKYIKIGRGVIICAGNIITTNIVIEDFVTLNLACTIGHDVRIESYTTIYPSVSISGNCNIGEKTEIGTKTAIIQGKNIIGGSIIGAGSVVIKDIEVRGTYVGIPIKLIKEY